MIAPEKPKNEAERLHALRTLKLLDTTHEERFDRVTRMAKRMFGVPISLVTLVDDDRQWFKSKQGLEVSETPREISFCGHAINKNGLFMVPNTLEDERFIDNPLVTGAPNIRFYAGYPLKLRQEVNIGTLCLIDSEPKILDEEEQQLLADLGAMIEQEIRSIQLATLDELTLISNRRGFLNLAEYSQNVCKKKKIDICMVLFDLNKFKLVNDEFGHHEGDFVLSKFAEMMLNTFRESDVIGRLGGDEFVVMLNNTNEEKIEKILARFDNGIQNLNEKMKKPYIIEYSIGVASFPFDTEKTIKEMLEIADTAMYEDKRYQSTKT